MTKDVLIATISSSNFNYNKKELLKLIKCLPNHGKIKPSTISKRDVFMHPIFHHPYIYLEKTEGYWICGLMTSDGGFEEVLEKCKSRFFRESYITKVLFTIKEPIGSFMGVYDNNRHLTTIIKKLKNLF